jgi:hypothetical protein
MGVQGGEGVVGNTIRVRGILYGLCVWVWVLVRDWKGDELGDARERGGEDMSGSGGGARFDPDPDPALDFDFDPNTTRNGLRIVRGGSALGASEDMVEQLHRLRSWWVSGRGVGGNEKGDMGTLSS